MALAVKEKLDLFSDATVASRQCAQAVLALKIHGDPVQLTAAQKRFNSLLAPLIARYRSADDMEALDEDEALAMEEAKAMFADLFGKELPADVSLETPQDLMAALARQMQREQGAEAAQREACKARCKPSARALAAEQQQRDAQGSLGTIYRQLAAPLAA